jgi:putative phosphoribosyl transferase
MNSVLVPHRARGSAGQVQLPENAQGLVVLVCAEQVGPELRTLAGKFQEVGLGSVGLDLLSNEERQTDDRMHRLRFDVVRMATRLIEITRQLMSLKQCERLPIGYFSVGTGAAAALVAAATLGREVAAVIACAGRPDLAGAALPEVVSPTLLIVGGRDAPGIGRNEWARESLRCENSVAIIPGATDLFDTGDAMEVVGQLAAHWFLSRFEPARETP